MLIYWMVVAVLRIILQSLLLLEIFIYNILEGSPFELLYTILEVLDDGKPQRRKNNLQHISESDSVVLSVVLISSLWLVWNLYKQLKHRDQNNFTRLQDEV